MRHIPLLIAVFVTATLAVAELAPLFDGNSIAGWKVRNGTASYVVEDGAIVGTTAEGSPNSFLSPPGEYGDFVLEFEVKADPRLNSGVQIRSHEYERETEVLTFNRGFRKRVHPAGRVHGYQVEIANEERGTSGGVYDEARRGWIANIADDPAASKAFRDHQWNHYRIEATGDRIRTWVNGAPCADLVDPLDLTGFLGFQVHSFRGDSPAQVRWRNIRIEDRGRHEWRPVFNGKNLDGWRPVGGGRWEAADGAIRGVIEAGSEGGFLMSGEPYDDFTVRLEYKAARGNSGFFFRARDLSQRQPGPRGFEVEIDPTRDPGGLQEPGGRGWIIKPPAEQFEQLYRAGEWNQLVVHAHGGRIVVHVNGHQTAELKDDGGRSRGFLAFQLNPRQAGEFWFRNIEMLRKAAP